MGVTILDRLRRPAMLTRWALAAVVVNVLLVVTGGAVRLTSSGLGCPTWPKCTANSLTPTSEYAVHGQIEFTNRLFITVISVIVLVILVLAILSRRQVKLAVLLVITVPAQAVLGGLSVLTKLNPWVVASHFLLSIVILSIAFLVWWRLREQPRPVPVASALPIAAWALLAVTAAVLLVGTVVTGSGPHAGAPDAAHRMHFAPSSVAQLHADLVMLLIGLTVGFAVLARAAGAVRRVQRAAWALLAVELAQGLIGFVQYFTHIPALLVAVHMLGACLVWLAALGLLAELAVHPFRNPSLPVAEPSVQSSNEVVTASS
jgi:cytochrome c oxidase assembly protein subunit 15